MIQNPVITDFTAGELSPKFSGRFDLSLYNKGVQEMENWVPFTQGGVITRPGTKYLGATKSGDARMVPFDNGTGYHFGLEMGANYIRVWNGDARFQTYGSDVEITTTYALAEVKKLQLQQVCNALYMVCDTQPIMVLTWTGVTFTLEALPIRCADNITAWVKNTAYVQGDLRYSYAKVYQCIIAGTSEAGTPLPAATPWYSICWSPALDLFCAVGDSCVATSSDGATWTSRTSASAQEWMAVCWSPELALLCAVAVDGAVGVQVMTSPDGITWTSQTSASARQWRAVCWSPERGLFCAVATDGTAGEQVMTSPDGITWTSRTSASVQEWWTVCWSPERGLFCAVARNGAVGVQVMTSPDGITWTSRTSASVQEWWTVCWSPERGLFCAVAMDGAVGVQVMTSPDGITWTSHASASARQWMAVCWSPERGLFCAVACNGAVGVQVMTSPDGITWTSHASAIAQEWMAVCWSPTQLSFVAVADTGAFNRVMLSQDGITWDQDDPTGPHTEALDIIDGTVHWDYRYQVPFSRVGDYPSCIAHFAGRMFFAASINDPQQAWASEPFDYGNFNYCDAVTYTLTQLKDAALWTDPLIPETETITVVQTVYGDGNAFYFEIASEQNDAILWLVGADALIIGTEASEWILGPDVTALNIQSRRRSGLGSVAVQAQLFGENPVFVQGGEGMALLREYGYLSGSSELQSPDLTFAADHILVTGVQQMDFVQLPHPVLNVVTKGGELAALLYNKPYNVMAWHRQVFTGRYFKSVAIVAGASEDVVYVLANINSIWTIERFNALWGITEQCLDSWSAHTIAGATEAGLTRLANLTATIINTTDGTVHTAVVSGAGVLTYPTGDGVGDAVVIGLAYTGSIQTMRIATQTRSGGPGMGTLKLIINVIARVLNCMPFEVSGDGTHWETSKRPDGVAWTTAYTGDVVIPVPGDWNREGCLYFRQTLPQRSTILALVPEIDA